VHHRLVCQHSCLQAKTVWENWKQLTWRTSTMSTWVSVSATVAPKLPFSWKAESAAINEASHMRGVKLRRPRRMPRRPGTSDTDILCSTDDSLPAVDDAVSAVVPADFTESTSFINNVTKQKTTVNRKSHHRHHNIYFNGRFPGKPSLTSSPWFFLFYLI